MGSSFSAAAMGRAGTCLPWLSIVPAMEGGKLMRKLTRPCVSQSCDNSNSVHIDTTVNKLDLPFQLVRFSEPSHVAAVRQLRARRSVKIIRRFNDLPG